MYSRKQLLNFWGSHSKGNITINVDLKFMKITCTACNIGSITKAKFSESKSWFIVKIKCSTMNFEEGSSWRGREGLKGKREGDEGVRCYHHFIIGFLSRFFINFVYFGYGYPF